MLAVTCPLPLTAPAATQDWPGTSAQGRPGTPEGCTWASAWATPSGGAAAVGVAPPPAELARDMLTHNPIPACASNLVARADLARAVAFEHRALYANRGIDRAAFGLDTSTERLRRLRESEMPDGSPTFDNATWNNATWNNATWNNATWNNATWNNATWNNATWNNATWNGGIWG
jgi:hypothetical protein